MARKEATSQRFVLVADGKDISQEIRAAQHVVRPVESVGRYFHCLPKTPGWTEKV